MKRTSLDFRSAHAWLNGYSDALAGRPSDPSHWSEYLHEDYERGYANGASRGVVREAA